MGTEVDGVKELSRKDKLMHELQELLKIYDEMLLREIELRKRDLVERKVIQNLNNSLVSADVLDKRAMYHFLHADDFITTKDEDKFIHNPLESLVYYNGGPIHEFIMRPFVDKRKYAGAQAYSVHYRNDRLKICFMTLAIISLLSALLTPVAILYFAEPGKPVSLSVVGFFGIAATVMMAMIPGIKLDTIFIAMSAYMAVMVTFLANFQGSNLS
ncbi:hypothetical protein QBC47DRAFT_367888 [Echria macrotheca]|uniref:DUF6594 domain-containing protein n=1 Tax=Echria macrotheca TaxID=438768 RepID=A0AAJ0FG70_9PEZI|nr:hypothetical protein QBC47DRAFT_367888 [Echria macrotheca]